MREDISKCIRYGKAKGNGIVNCRAECKPKSPMVILTSNVNSVRNLDDKLKHWNRGNEGLQSIAKRHSV
jgi:hypothetical protein